MKKVALIFNMPLVLQILENSKSQLVFYYIEYMFLVICFASASIVMMFIPIILCYSMVDNFIDMNDYKNKINKEISCQEDNTEYLKSICHKYLKSFSNFFKNFTALAAWNIFSLIYIVFGFGSFSNGLREYFYFPFAIFQSLNKSKIFNSIYQFQSNWSFMITIIILTFSFYFFGKYIGSYMAKNKIKKKGLNLLSTDCY
tara:strand:- start:42730 stop:43329 length:600 start_codon:yes stop_codon:yes gene_type:complete